MKTFVVAAALLLAGLPGCAVRHTLSVTGSELHRNLGALRRYGVATVDMIEHRDDRDGARTRVESLRADQPLTLDGRPRAIEVLAKGCRDVAPFAGDVVSQADCPLVRMRERVFEVRSFRTVSVRRPVGLTALLLAGALGGFVFDELRGSDSTVETVGNYGLGALGGILTAGALWMIVDCKGRWGKPGCRD